MQIDLVKGLSDKTLLNDKIQGFTLQLEAGAATRRITDHGREARQLR